MPRGSGKFRELKERLEQLRTHLLGFLPPPPGSKTAYSLQEQDLTRSYVILAHAEIESFCEGSVAGKAAKAMDAYTRDGTVTPVLRRLTAYYVGSKRKSWSHVLSPSFDVINSASMSFAETVRDNNGIRRRNIEKLLYPIGVDESSLDGTWLAGMDSFGVDRGNWAHNSARALNPPDPNTALGTVTQLLEGLLDLDRLISALR